MEKQSRRWRGGNETRDRQWRGEIVFDRSQKKYNWCSSHLYHLFYIYINHLCIIVVRILINLSNEKLTR